MKSISSSRRGIGRLAVSVLPVLATCATQANAAVVGYWNFNDLTTFPSNLQFGASTGAGVIFADGSNGSSSFTTGGSNPELSSIAGSSLGASNGDPAGLALKVANSSANGKSIVIRFSMAGFSGLGVQYDVRRVAGTGAAGFDPNVWEWSTDASSWNELATVSVTDASSFVTKTIAPTSALDGAAVAYLRITFVGASGPNGHNRIDNLTLSATAVPAPGSIALLGAAGLIASRRRRA